MKRFLPFLVLAAIVGCSTEDGPTNLGSVASDFTVETLTVPRVKASLHKRRGKVILLDFWATWCGPCRQISPELEAIYERHKGEGLEAMSISGESRDVLAQYEARSPHKMPVYVDANGSAALNMDAKSLPTIQVIGRDGRIIYDTRGITENTGHEIEEVIVKALEAKA